MRRLSPRRRRVLLTGMSALFIFPLVILLFGGVEGEEFAPGLFQRRNFHYFELPIVRIQVWPVRRMDITSDLGEFLVAKGYVARQPKPTRWDLVRSHRSGRSWRPGEAHIICQYLDAVDHAGTGFWLRWTRKQPDLAQVLWPEVAKLGQDQLYVLMPDLFLLAVGADDPQKLQNQLDQVLANSLERLADIRKELSEYDTAAEFYTRAMDYDPERASCQQGRSFCHNALEEQR